MVTTGTRIVIIANESAGNSDVDWLEEKTGQIGAELALVDSPEASIERSQAAASDLNTLVVAAGGDGSIGHVVQGIMNAHSKSARMGILPLGTGNDLARSLDIPLDREEAWGRLFTPTVRPIDVIRMETASGVGWWISNIAVAGPTQETYEAADQGKKSWGAFGFIAAALAALEGIRPFGVKVALNGKQALEFSRLTHIVIANAKSMGGGLEVAPNAEPDNGYAEFVFMAAEDVLAVASLGVSALMGTHLDDPRVRAVRARTAEFLFDREVGIQCDGHERNVRWVRFTTHPRAINVVGTNGADDH